MKPVYKRILLKLSGEALMGDDPYGVNRETIDRIVSEIKEVCDLDVEVGVVIGGGNIFRGMAPAAAGRSRRNGGRTTAAITGRQAWFRSGAATWR